MPSDALEILDTLFLVLSFVLGSVVGSFLNVCICRLPKKESVIHPRSHCPKCGSGIAWYDNIPILSWLILGARCRNCREPISWQYPVVEGLTGLLFLAVYWRFGYTLATPIYMLLAAALVLTTFIDLTDWTIPNEVTYPGIPLGVALSLVGMFYPASGLIVQDVFHALGGVVLGGGILYLLDKVALVFWKKPGMGFGDVKLLAMLGAFLGVISVPVIIMISSLVGSVVGITMVIIQKRRGVVSEGHYLPFGPYLALAGLIYLFFGQDLIDLYMGLMHIPEATGVLTVQ
ncbi:MAG TPA: prepilin peptidase [Candidatus Bathyarchaeia archaeon]|nr:prepilin peptidase [Candidatus Bathyarchaeia archaeon]